MKIGRTAWLGLATLGLLLGAVTPAQAWETIATRVASAKLSHDVVMVTGEARYTRIKVCAERHAVRLHFLALRFKNGQRQEVAVRGVIGAGDCTRVIDLAGVTRDITSIRLDYEAANPRKRRAILTVLAE